MLDEFGRHDASSDDAPYLPTKLPWRVDEHGAVDAVTGINGRDLTSEAYRRDAERFALAFCRDARALHGHNHDHNCSFTCVKYAKPSAKKLAEESTGTERNIVCRFNYFVVKVFEVVSEGVTKIKRLRRRGKELVPTPYIANNNDAGEFGRVQVLRLTPFRGPTTDVGQCGVRSNLDFQFMPRAAVLSADLEATESSSQKNLSYDRAEAFYGIRLQLPHDIVLRQAATSMLAMWQAAHNTDYYITKYGTKALEQLQHLMGQFALGLRRLELEEKDDEQITPAQKARQITLRLANAANRSTWASCCEMALFVRTKAHARRTYYPRQIYLSRLAYVCHTCGRLMNQKLDYLLEPFSEPTTSMFTFSVAKHVHKDDAVSDDAASNNDAVSSEDAASNDDAVSNEDAKSDEEAVSNEDPDEGVADDLKVEMKTLRATTSAHDDWLHRGPYLYELPFHTYVEYVDRISFNSRNASNDKQIFLFEAHYALSGDYCQRIRTPARTPVLEALKFPPPGETTKEENAMYKLLVGSFLCCKQEGCCSDPQLFKPFYTRSHLDTGVFSMRPTWKARRAEIEVLAKRGEEKTERSRQIPCIHDTTLIRGWLDATCKAQSQPLQALLCATLSQLMLSHCAKVGRFDMMRPDSFTPLLEFLGIANAHRDQLTLAEFSAIRIRRLVQNLDMMAVARTVELPTKKKGGNVEDDLDCPDQKLSCEDVRFEGGEAQDVWNVDDVIPEEQFDNSSPLRPARMTIDKAISILRRDAEVAAAKKRVGIVIPTCR